MLEHAATLDSQQADKQLAEITRSLKHLVEQIRKERPDVVMSLDKGARILLKPIERYLRKSGNVEKTVFTPYNVTALKSTRLEEPGASEARALQDFGAFKGKKVFFIDETFSMGRNAVATLWAADVAGVGESKYFALTDAQSINPRVVGLQKFREQGRVHVCPHNIEILFTRPAGSMYLDDTNPDGIRPHKVDSEKRKDDFKKVAEVRRKIYKALLS